MRPRFVAPAGDPSSSDTLPADPGSARAAPAPDRVDQPDAGPSERGRFTVQLGAFSSEGRAEALRQRVADAGFEARLVTVPGSSLIRVRVGVFDAQEGARVILERLRELGFTAALARDAHREERGGQ